MAQVQVPIVVAVDDSAQQQTSLSAVTEVILRARGSNVQAISANVSSDQGTDPGGDGSDAFVLFPGESIQVPTVPTTPQELFAKYIAFEYDDGLANPVLEIIKIA